MIKIDIESLEFKEELQRTKAFVEEVCTKNNLVLSSIDDLNDGVIMGLTRNNLIYNKRYCPCSMVLGKTKQEQEKLNERVCPCKPALENEIPKDGKCHCGLFCTKQYNEENSISNISQTNNHSQGLSIEECEDILNKEQLDSNEMIVLLEARELKMIDFLLVDVREWMEWKRKRIVGTDVLIPTTTFYDQLSQIEDSKDKAIILYCFTGSRSAYCQDIMKSMGWKKVSNFTRGIIVYKGETTSGE